MPVIVLCSTKGGVGKSTTALVLAQVFAQAGSTVTLIDADPNQPLAAWAATTGDAMPERLNVIGNVNEETVLEAIDDAAITSPFVIVDLEGSANVTATYAISRADLVLIPMRGKQLDAVQASRVVSMIERESRAFRRPIPYRIMFSMTSALVSKEQRHIHSFLESKGIPVLPVSMTERAAFSAIFQIGGTIFDLESADVSNPQSAIDNANLLASAIIETIQSEDAAK